MGAGVGPAKEYINNIPIESGPSLCFPASAHVCDLGSRTSIQTIAARHVFAGKDLDHETLSVPPRHRMGYERVLSLDIVS